MVAISFSVFKEKLLSGEKSQTIRPYSEQRYKQLLMAKEGKYNLQIYWKLRTKECQKLFDARCTDVFLVQLRPLMMNGEDFEELWRRDGFESEEEFYKFFEEKYGNLEGKVFVVVRFERIRG